MPGSSEASKKTDNAENLRRKRKNQQTKQLFLKSIKLLKPLLNDTTSSCSNHSKSSSNRRINLENFRRKTTPQSKKHQRSCSVNHNESSNQNCHLEHEQVQQDTSENSCPFCENTKAVKRVKQLRVQTTSSTLNLDDVLTPKLPDRDWAGSSKISTSKRRECYFVEYQKFKDGATQTYRMIKDEWMQVHSRDSSLESMMVDGKSEELVKIMAKAMAEYVKNHHSDKEALGGENDAEKGTESGQQIKEDMSTIEWIRRSLLNSYLQIFR